MLVGMLPKMSNAQTAGKPASNACSAAFLRSEGPARGMTATDTQDKSEADPLLSYIKELADRIIFIEGKLGGQTLDPQMLDIGGGARRTPVEELPSALLNDNSKRPFSSVSSDIFNTPIASRLVAWASEQQPPQQSPPAPQSYGRGRLLPKPSEAELPEAPEAPVDAVESLPTGIKDDLHRGIDELTFVG